MLALLATVCYGLADSALAAGPLLAVGALGVVGTGIAFVLMGRLVSRVGSARASFATYLIPSSLSRSGSCFTERKPKRRR